MPTTYRCPNIRNCDKADAHELITIPPGAEPRCPECATNLALFTPPGGRGIPRQIAVGVAVVLALGLGWWLWPAVPSKENPYKTLARQSWDNDRIIDPSEQAVLDKLAEALSIDREQARQWLESETGVPWPVIAEGQYKWLVHKSWDNDRTIDTTERAELDKLAKKLEIASEQAATWERDIIGTPCLLAQSGVPSLPWDHPSSLTPEDLKRMLPMSLVPEGTAEVPEYLKDWLRDIQRVTVPRPFYVMAREVTVGEFRRYVTSLDEAQRKQLGDAWQGDPPGERPDQRPVSSVPWWAAKGYADWLSQMTGCTLMLPTVEHWMAAVVKHARPEREITRASGLIEAMQRPVQPDQVYDLLGNLREWSADECKQGDETGHYWVGEDYSTWRQNISGKPDCRAQVLRGVGFRLIWQDSGRPPG